MFEVFSGSVVELVLLVIDVLVTDEVVVLVVDVALLDLGTFADVAFLVVVDVIIPFVVSPSEMLKKSSEKTHIHYLQSLNKKQWLLKSQIYQ